MTSDVQRMPTVSVILSKGNQFYLFFSFFFLHFFLLIILFYLEIDILLYYLVDYRRALKDELFIRQVNTNVYTYKSIRMRTYTYVYSKS